MDSKEDYLAQNRSHAQIRSSGAIGNLNEGIEIMINNLPTRLIAWPGNGFQTESVHVITVKPGLESPLYNYQISEEALLCVQGKGEVYLRDQWVEIEPGDIAYFPENIKHGIRNATQNRDDFILVSSITPPLVSLYIDSGFYIEELGKMDFDAAEAAKKASTPGKLSPINHLRYRETHSELRAWNLKANDVRKNGGLFNMFKGAEFNANGSPMRFILWPGHGSRQCGFHLTRCATGDLFAAHTHPVSDECVIVWAGSARGFLDNHWLEMGIHECLLAPCGVPHGGPLNIKTQVVGTIEQSKDTLWGGFASPPQGDLYLRAGYIQNQKVQDPVAVRFNDIEPLD
ncbi:cupin domain-containing protein [Legionella maioricensis]|uniref:Cupin domain-containing protein n=1 Tax=Legionella maioricensis TaxID=2896528 RepID=A0A9X2D066_9GAMM|nr:cupin domain-containing protein [Legionella maioricensis]MCL9683998.1 cupin domain-containing protein [Legionella maioricensis]MCL9687957.1 cupin domain-containing protein [Legionella maioricensis]